MLIIIVISGNFCLKILYLYIQFFIKNIEIKLDIHVEMFQGFFQQTQKNVSFEDVQYIISKPKDYIIINTLEPNNQQCLIKNTISHDSEESIINERLTQYDFTPQIVVYGTNANDENVNKKAKQLSNLGFSNVYLYVGGMFEWLMLQDIYGQDEFPTTSKFLDILFYKPTRAL